MSERDGQKDEDSDPSCGESGESVQSGVIQESFTGPDAGMCFDRFPLFLPARSEKKESNPLCSFK